MHHPSPPPGADPALWNEDLAPTAPAARTWGRWHIAALWVGMAVCIPTYTLASGLLSQGLDWLTATALVLVGNLIVCVPMVLNARPGARYGIPFPVLARASFGTRGANIPAMMRALVACGWFGIQTWFGGLALYTLAALLWPGLADSPHLGDLIGLNLAQLLAFLAFWGLNVLVIIKGMEAIRFLETWSAPVLLALGLGLLVWGFTAGGGASRVLEASSAFGRPAATLTLVTPDGAPGTGTLSAVIAALPATDAAEGAPETPRATAFRAARLTPGSPADARRAALEAAPWTPLPPDGAVSLGEAATNDLFVIQLKSPSAPKGTATVELKVPKPGPAPARDLFWAVLLPGLTAMIGYWASLSLNISDFTRFARSQRDQLVGQLVGLPPTMVLYAFIGIAVTAASLLIFDDLLWAPDAPWDPVNLIARIDSPPLVAFAMVALAVATLTTNIAANVVSPANDFANLAPRWISFRTGGLITAVLGVVIMPWKLLASAGDYLFVWLVGYSALLGPVGGIMIADYFLVRRGVLDVDALYARGGVYAYGGGGINWRAVAIFALSVLPNLPGFLAAAQVVERDAVPELFHTFYTYAWFLGFGLAAALHWAFGVARAHRPSQLA
jgi:cytosine/uracil/thiamine/allantoin permease